MDSCGLLADLLRGPAAPRVRRRLRVGFEVGRDGLEALGGSGASVWPQGSWTLSRGTSLKKMVNAAMLSPGGGRGTSSRCFFASPS